MAAQLHLRPYFIPRNLTSSRNRPELEADLLVAFNQYGQFFEQTLMTFQRNWAAGILGCDRQDLEFLIVKCLALLIYYRQCFHTPFLGELDLALDENKPAFIYTSSHKLQSLLRNSCSATFGTEEVLATTIPPYCGSLSRREMSCLHNIIFPGRLLHQSDMECFMAILPSTLFSTTCALKVIKQDGKEIPCRFLFRTATLPRPYDIVAFGHTLFHAEADTISVARPSAPCVDLLYDYRRFLQQSEICGHIGYYPKGNRRPTVAILGGGLASHIAAFELLRAGAKNVTVFEARDHVGQKRKRNSTCSCVQAAVHTIRYSVNQTCLIHYLDKFKIAAQTTFPTPGAVDTALYFEGALHFWSGGQSPPEMFRSVYEGWQALLQRGCERNNLKLMPPVEITAMLKAGCFAKAQLAWQDWLKAFGNLSLCSALEIIFTGTVPPGGRQWKIPEDFQILAILGVGPCGLSSLKQVGFTEVLRSIINDYHGDQRLIPSGMATLLVQLRNQKVQNSKLREHLCIEGVVSVRKTSKKIEVKLCTGKRRYFDRAIVTACPQIMESSYGLTPDSTFFSDEVIQATKEVHHTGISKLLIITESKFWIKESLPIIVRGNGQVQEACCLDYDPENPDGHGVVLLSYDWAATAYEPMDAPEKKQRCEALVKDLADFLPEFAVHLVPRADDYDHYVFCDGGLRSPFDAGALKLNAPGQDASTQRLFFQFQDANCKEKDKGLYLAGSHCSFSGAWAEGAAQTGVNAACAVIRSTGGLLFRDNPLDGMSRNYGY